VKLIVGLGNPGEQYRLSRHNLGFLSLDYLAKNHGLPSFKQRFDALFAKGKIGGEAAILAKPQTYMNLSGASLEKLAAYFKVEINDIIIIHDDLDLPFQTVRLKKGGGYGGHKGLISIAEHLGSSDFLRVRIGIGKPVRKEMVESYVLSPLTEEESEALPRVIALVGDAVRDVVLLGIEAAMCRYNGMTVVEPDNAQD
jgi:peptidyl-tRNA hydrolase, PTH1 family